MNMSQKILLLSVILVAPCFAADGPTVSGGTVREEASCTTADGAYVVFVSSRGSNEKHQPANIGAHVENADGVTVAGYRVQEIQGPRSVSFGRGGYIDQDNQGANFMLQGPSTNFRHYSIDVQIKDGKNSLRIKDDDLNCTVFGGVVLGQP